jgi:branched-chain amino acid transport system substrate-binding protein
VHFLQNCSEKNESTTKEEKMAGSMVKPLGLSALGAPLGRRDILLGALAGGIASALPRGARADDSSPIKLGAILPLTGPAAAVGTQQQRGLIFGVEQINKKGGVAGRPLEITYEDDQGRPDQAVLSFNKFVDLYSFPLIFSAYSGPTLAMAPLATRKEVVLINGGAQADRLAKASPYLFNTIPVAGDEIAVLCKYLLENGKKKAAVLYENDAAGAPSRDDFIKSFTAGGGAITGQEPSATGQTDYRPALLKLSDTKPDVLFAMLSDGLGALAEQLRQMKPDFVVAGTSFFNDPEALRNPGSNGWLHTQVKIAAPPEMAAAFKDKFNIAMEFWGSQYSNAVYIVAKAIARTIADKAQLTGVNIRKAFFDVKTFDVMLPAVFTTNTAEMEIDIVQTQDGTHHLVKEYKAG